VTEEDRQPLADIDGALAVWAPAYAELERMAGSGDAENATKLLVERITPQYQLVEGAPSG